MADSLTLYQLEDDLAALVETLECADSEQRQELIARIEETELRTADKCDAMARFVSGLSHQERYADAEIERLTARRDAIKAARERLQNYILYVMHTRGLKKLEGRTSTICLRKNPDSVEITDEASIPAEYKSVKTEVTPRKNDIKAALKAGKAVAGARLRPGDDRIEIR
jgi:hypothetical protein